MVSTVMKQPALVKSWQFPIDYEVPCTFTCIVLLPLLLLTLPASYLYHLIVLYLCIYSLLLSGDKSVVKARISGTSAAHIYFDGFIFNFPNQAVK